MTEMRFPVRTTLPALLTRIPIEKKLISAKGAHRYAELLTPYLSRQSGIADYRSHEPYLQAAENICVLEFESMLERQWTGPQKSEEREKLRLRLRDYVRNLLKEQIGVPARCRINNPADELVPMCSVIAFIGRNPNEN